MAETRRDFMGKIMAGAVGGAIALGLREVSPIASVTQEPATPEVSVNIHNRVSVVLTDKGLEVYREYHRDIVKQCGNPKRPDGTRIFDRCINRTDKNLVTQLWCLMEVFGPKIFMAGPTMFESNKLMITT